VGEGVRAKSTKTKENRMRTLFFLLSGGIGFYRWTRWARWDYILEKIE
jgi:hypothetical protein